jgi:hypothetical protein
LRHNENWETERWRLLGITLLVWLGYGTLTGWIVAVIIPQGWGGAGSGIGWASSGLAGTLSIDITE